MPRKYVTKRLVKHISFLTNQLFKDSIIEVLDIRDATDEQITEFMGVIRRITYAARDIEEFSEEFGDTIHKKELIDELYLTKMVSLSTKDLIDILFLHEHHKPRRAERTLEAITSELARRSLLNDSSQSDAIYKNRGDMDVKRKGKLSSKKTNSKKRKANKN